MLNFLIVFIPCVRALRPNTTHPFHTVHRSRFSTAQEVSGSTARNATFLSGTQLLIHYASGFISHEFVECEITRVRAVNWENERYQILGT